MEDFVQYDKYRPTKEAVRKKIKQALLTRNTKSFTSFDLNADILEPIEDSYNEFRANYKAAGGKHIVCDKEQFPIMLVELLRSQKYSSLLNTATVLDSLLDQEGIKYYKAINPSEPVDAAIVLSEMLVARNGAMVFSQNYSLYPSVKGLAKDIIVVAMANSIVPDLKSVLKVQQENQGALSNMLEIITPGRIPVEGGKEVFSPENPRYILFLVN